MEFVGLKDSGNRMLLRIPFAGLRSVSRPRCRSRWECSTSVCFGAFQTFLQVKQLSRFGKQSSLGFDV